MRQARPLYSLDYPLSMRRVGDLVSIFNKLLTAYPLDTIGYLEFPT